MTTATARRMIGGILAGITLTLSLAGCGHRTTYYRAPVYHQPAYHSPGYYPAPNQVHVYHHTCTRSRITGRSTCS